MKETNSGEYVEFDELEKGPSKEVEDEEEEAFVVRHGRGGAKVEDTR